MLFSLCYIGCSFVSNVVLEVGSMLTFKKIKTPFKIYFSLMKRRTKVGLHKHKMIDANFWKVGDTYNVSLCS